MKQARQYFAMSIFGEADILVCGGHVDDTCLKSCELYNSATNVWTNFLPLPNGVYQFTMTTLHGRPYVLGGWNGTATVNSLYAFDNNKWTPKAYTHVTRIWDESAVFVF
jgi:hypothetical protein